MENLVAEILETQLPGREEKPALLFPGGQVTYGQLWDQVNRATALFRGLRLQPGERVLMMLPDGPEFPIAWFAAIKAGGVSCAIAPETTVQDLPAYLNLTQARIAVVHRAHAAKLDAVRANCPHLQCILWAGDGEPDSFHAQLKQSSPDSSYAPTRAEEPAAWLFTAGTTGFPKAAVHSHRDFVFSARAYGLSTLEVREDDVCLSFPKLPFGYGLGNNLLFPLLAGATTVLFPEKSTPERVLELIRAHRPTLLSAVPTAISNLLRSEALAQTNLSCLRRMVSAGETLPATLYQRWKEATGVEVVEGLGSSEMFHIYLSNRLGEVKPGSLGKVVPGYQVKICNPQGQELPPGEIGSIWVKGGSMAQGYFASPEATQQTFRGEWCVTADQAYQDAEGQVFFCGRNDDLFKVSGRWVAPAEVENALLSHPAVRECAVVGCLDGNGLAHPIAFCVSQLSGSQGLETELITWVRERLAPFKAPRQVVLMEALPRNERGKVHRAVLKKLWPKPA